MKHSRRILSLILVLSMVFGMFAVSASAETAAPALSAEEFAAPSMQYRPGVRWWLPGGDITAEEMTREVNLLADNGFGHAEINPFGTDVRGYDNTAPHDKYLTAEYYAAVEAAVATAAQRGFTVNINMGSGWNANDPSVAVEDSLGNMAIGRQIVTVAADAVGKEQIVSVPALEVSPSYSTGKLTANDKAELLGLMIGKVAGLDEGHITKGTLNGEKTEDQILLDPANITMVDLQNAETTSVAWTPAAEGDYALVAVYSYPTGCRPIDSVNTNDAFVIDHMDYDVVVNYMETWMGEGTPIGNIMKKYPGTVGSFFNDSYEFYGDTYFNTKLYELAKDAENNPLGYDFSPYLVNVYDTCAMWPFYMVMFGMVNASNDNFLAISNTEGTAKDADVQNRITYDYNQLTNELFLEGMKGFSEVANKYGSKYRQEAYNTPSDTIGSAKYVDIPEDEQQKEDTMKRTASGSHLYNRPVTTTEQFTLGNTPFQNDMAKLKTGFDMMATGGINNFNYHGFNYQYFGNEQMQAETAYGETGWSAFFGIGVNMTEANSLFKYWEELNAYAARLNMLGQQGDISMDAVVYMPFGGTLSNTKGAGKVFNAYGYTWDAINDEALQEMASYDAKNGVITIEGSPVTYKSIVVETNSLPVASMEALKALAAAGANVVFYNTVPNRQPGYAAGNYAAEDAKVAAIAAEMIADGTASVNSEADLAAALGATNEVTYTYNANLRMIRRTLADGSEIAYVRSTDAKNANEVTFVIPETYETVYWLDQNTGKIHTAEVVDGQITVTLAENGAIGLLACPAGVAYAADVLSAGVPQSIDAIWAGTAEAEDTVALEDFTLTVTADNIATNGAYGEEKTVTYTENVLGNWKSDEFQNGALQHVNADGIYTTTVTIDETYDSQFVLDLGEVYTGAEVTVNGEYVGAVLYAPYKIDITDYVTEGENTVEIAVTPRTWNRYAGFRKAYDAAKAAGDEAGMKLYQYYSSVSTSLVDAGLAGPVAIEVYDDPNVAVTVELKGESEVTVETDELTYTVALADAVQVATATVTMAVSGNVVDVAAEGAGDWFVLLSTYEDGILTAIVCNKAGVTGEDDMLNVVVTTDGENGTVSVALTDIVLSAYAGTDSETFVDVALGNTEVTTEIKYSIYDVNQDGVVDQLDITRAQRCYGDDEGAENWNPRADVNGDKTVDINDLILILNNYTK